MQTTVKDDLDIGVPGTFALSGFSGGFSATLSGSGDKNRAGRALTRSGDTVTVGGAGAFAGVLVNAGRGVSENLLRRELVEGQLVECCTHHPGVFVETSTGTTVADGVAFVQATGVFKAVAVGASAAAGETVVKNASWARSLPGGVGILHLSTSGA